eukprot:TRINITY_DN1054_c0_g7_i1.p1 TRINITY_DN1054_c0_g7~~TRINITY_DN1054_c0_g7_i1.p1  ORF type:complete len:377 (-),score=45.38 TRINITY_DN1054_c0_g7_i1:44-1174(-)
MNLGEFMRFCKDFSISLSLSKIKALFKKTAFSSKRLDWTCFKVILRKIAVEINKDKISELQRKYAESKGEELKSMIEDLNNKSEEAQLTELHNFMGCADPPKYKKKLIGIQLPFNTHDKQYRIPVSTRRHKFIDHELAHREARPTEEQRMIKYARGRRVLKNTYRIRLKDSVSLKAQEVIDDSMHENRGKELMEDEERDKSAVVVKKPKEFTWNLLNELSYNDINDVSKEDLIAIDLLENENKEIISKQPTSTEPKRVIKHYKNSSINYIQPAKPQASPFNRNLQPEHDSRNKNINRKPLAYTERQQLFVQKSILEHERLVKKNVSGEIGVAITSRAREVECQQKVQAIKVDVCLKCRIMIRYWLCRIGSLKGECL